MRDTPETLRLMADAMDDLFGTGKSSEVIRDHANAWAADIAGLNPEAVRIARDVLFEAGIQIAYLHEKFHETGSGNAVIAKIDAALAALESQDEEDQAQV